MQIIQQRIEIRSKAIYEGSERVCEEPAVDGQTDPTENRGD